MRSDGTECGESFDVFAGRRAQQVFKFANFVATVQLAAHVVALDRYVLRSIRVNKLDVSGWRWEFGEVYAAQLGGQQGKSLIQIIHAQ